ncbi:unnamed protein product [Allacma fusca]|uniref:Uncharacterized protein n=1 Tax=Allacma fusca TaxID=39272 RepID=A0A8J2PKM7_9HEXA|nr:unnamed protein product [Allacma fusca]
MLTFFLCCSDSSVWNARLISTTRYWNQAWAFNLQFYGGTNIFARDLPQTTGPRLPAGFEPAREDPIGLAVQRLNHSAKAASLAVVALKPYLVPIPQV